MSKLSNIDWQAVIDGKTASQFMASAKEPTIEEAALAHCRRLHDNWSRFFDESTTKEVAAWGLAAYLSRELGKETPGSIPSINPPGSFHSSYASCSK